MPHPPRTDTDPLLLPVEEVERQLGIGRTRLYELFGSGELASVKIGRRRMVRRTDLEAFVANLEDAA